jgi:DNA-binding transcriptional LysR family regulator
LKALRGFEVSARHRSFTRAAEELCVTPSAVSYQIRCLEDWLGFSLFHRANNMLVLTGKGEHYAALLSTTFRTLIEGTEALTELGASSNLTINVRPHFAARWLTPRLGGFAADHPEVHLRLITSYQAPLALEDETDLAIVTHDSLPNIRYDLLFDAEIFPVCSPSLIAARRVEKPRDLLSFTRLHVISTTPEWRLLLASAGVVEPEVEEGPRFETNELALVAAESGWGVAIGRWPFVEKDVRAGRLVIPLALLTPSAKKWYLASRVNARSRKIEVFRDWIVREANKTRVETHKSDLASFRRQA